MFKCLKALTSFSVMFCATIAGANPALRIMPLGDSITYGSGSEETAGYRGPLWTKLTTAGYEVDYVGTRTDNPGIVSGMDPDHQGNPGWGVGGVENGQNGLAEYVGGWFGTIDAPHVVLLHIGTNDAGSEDRFAGIIASYRILLDRICTAEPDARVIVSTLLWRGDNADRCRRIQTYFNASIADLVAEQTALGRHVSLVDMYAKVGSDAANFTSDQVHPSAAGYALMADAWCAEIERLFPDPQNVPTELAPAVVNAVAETSYTRTKVTLTFNQSVDATAAQDLANYGFSDAELGTPTLAYDGERRTATLTWNSGAYGRVLEISLSGIAAAGGSKTIAQTLTQNFPAAGGVTWEAPRNITGDADVSLEGESCYAYTQSRTATTVNGVKFLSGAGAGNWPSAGSIEPDLVVAGFNRYYDQYLPGDVEFPSGMSVAYHELINSGVYYVTQTESATFALKNLTPGHQYLVQIWVNDSRATSANNDCSLILDEQVGVRCRVAGTSFGQYAVGRFTATNTYTTISARCQASNPNNCSLTYCSLQVRDVTPGRIAWEPSRTIYDDTDVRTDGEPVFAFSGSASRGWTVNGVTFAAAGGGAATAKAQFDFDGASVTPYDSTSRLNAYATYPETATSVYTEMLGCLLYAPASKYWTLRFKNLVPGERYLVQIWYNDSRAASGGNSVLYQWVDGCREISCQDFDNGRRGAYVTGTFTATDVTQAVPFIGRARASTTVNASMTAIQLRHLSATTTFENGWVGYRYATNAQDVATGGTTVYACTPGGNDITVNGVTFKKQNGSYTGWEDGKVAFTGMHNYHDNAFMNTYAGPDLGTYRGLLQRAVWSSRSQCPELKSTLTFSDLEPHQNYLLQVWVNDNRESGVKPAVEYGSSGRLAYRHDEEPHFGPIGYAHLNPGDGTTASIDIVYGVIIGYSGDYSSPQINALQLRKLDSPVDLESPGMERYVEWNGYGAPWNDAAKGGCHTAVLSNGGTMTLAGDATFGAVYSSKPMEIVGEGALTVLGNVEAPTCTVHAVWSSPTLARVTPGLTTLAGDASALRQIVAVEGAILYAPTVAPAERAHLFVTNGAAVTVATDLTVGQLSLAPGTTLTLSGTGLLTLPSDSDLSNVRFVVDAAVSPMPHPVLASARGAFATEPTFVLPNASYHVEKRVSDTGAEVWWLRQSKGTTFIFR